jgi:hypothetical protein
LDAVPEADRPASAVLIASRAAARAVPSMWAKFHNRLGLDMPIWRVVAIARGATIFPKRGIAPRAAASDADKASALVDASQSDDGARAIINYRFLGSGSRKK